MSTKVLVDLGIEILEIPEKSFILLEYGNPCKGVAKECQELRNYHSEHWEVLFKLAKTNGLLYPLCRNVQLLENIPEIVRKRACELLSNEAKAINNLRERVKIISAMFEEANVGYVIMKTVRSYPCSCADIDIIVDEHTIEKALRTLEELGYNIYRGIIPYEPYKIVCKSSLTQDVDIYPKVAWRGLTYLSEARVLGRRKALYSKEPKIYLPSDEDELLIVCSHASSHCNVLLGDVFHILLLLKKRQDSMDWNYVMKAAEANGTLPILFWFLILVHKVSEYSIGSTVIPSEVFDSFQKFWTIKLFDRFIVGNIFKNRWKFPFIFSPILLLITMVYGEVSDIRARNISLAFERVVKSISQLGRLMLVILKIYSYR